MRKAALTSTAAALLLSVVSIAATSQSAVSSTAKPTTLTFDVQFSPFTLIPANPVRDPSSPFALGDEIVFHDLLFSRGKQVGDQWRRDEQVLKVVEDEQQQPGAQVRSEELFE